MDEKWEKIKSVALLKREKATFMCPLFVHLRENKCGRRCCKWFLFFLLPFPFNLPYCTHRHRAYTHSPKWAIVFECVKCILHWTRLIIVPLHLMTTKCLWLLFLSLFNWRPLVEAFEQLSPFNLPSSNSPRSFKRNLPSFQVNCKVNSLQLNPFHVSSLIFVCLFNLSRPLK